MPEFVGNDGRKHFYVTDYDGPWQVCSGGPFTGYSDRTWYIVNIETGKTKKIGPVTGKGKNYHDAACEEAKRRNIPL